MTSSFRVAIAGGCLLVLAILAVPGKKSPDQLYNETRASVLYMLEPVTRRGGGTGFVVETLNGEKYTLTNAHVCRMTDRGAIAVTDGERSPLILPILAIAEDTDLCILPAFPGVRPLKLAGDMDLYEHINIVGHPLLLPTAFSSGYANGRKAIELRGSPNPTTGRCEGIVGGGEVVFPLPFGDAGDIFAAFAACTYSVDANWSDAKSYPGNSGSPVVNDQGEVVGVLFAGNQEYFSFFIPLDSIKRFLRGY